MVSPLASLWLHRGLRCCTRLLYFASRPSAMERCWNRRPLLVGLGHAVMHCSKSMTCCIFEGENDYSEACHREIELSIDINDVFFTRARCARKCSSRLQKPVSSESCFTAQRHVGQHFEAFSLRFDDLCEGLRTAIGCISQRRADAKHAPAFLSMHILQLIESYCAVQLRGKYIRTLTHRTHGFYSPSTFI